MTTRTLGEHICCCCLVILFPPESTIFSSFWQRSNSRDYNSERMEIVPNPTDDDSGTKKRQIVSEDNGDFKGTTPSNTLGNFRVKEIIVEEIKGFEPLDNKQLVENLGEEARARMTSDLLMDVKEINLNLLVDKEKNQVMWCEANSDFIDFLLSFLLLPMGTIVRVTEKQSEIGCMDNLYRSVEKFTHLDFNTEACQTMLLKPRRATSAEFRCNNLVHKIDHEPRENYCCPPCQSDSKKSCFVMLSMFPNAKCTCGKEMARLHLNCIASPPGGFVRKGRCFISDSLKLLTESTAISLQQHSKAVEIRSIVVGKDQLLNLLKRAFVSKTPMTDAFLQSSGDAMETFEHSDQVKMTQSQLFLDTPVSLDQSKSFSLELWFNKSNNKILCAYADAIFVDFLFSFLTFPVGSITKLFDGNSSIGSIDDLYNSVQFLFDNNMLDEYCKNLLLNPKISSMWGIDKQLLEVEEAEYDLPRIKCRGFVKWGAYMNPKFKTTMLLNGSVYVRQGGKYAVTDDLEIKPSVNLCLYGRSVDMPINGLEDDDTLRYNSYVFGVHSTQIEKWIVNVGEREALDILHTAMTSRRRVLTKVFCKGPEKRKRVGWRPQSS